jgi:acetyl-CoA carboxylase biotin carboxyl carrier protein
MYPTHDDVQEILRLLETSRFDELTLETGRYTLTLRREGPGADDWTQETRTLGAPDDPAARSAATTVAAAPIPDGHAAVHSPQPGTFYRAPQPGAAPFIEVGSEVGPDTEVGIVETMKLMNSVPAGCHGTVTEIRVANATPVARDEVLLLIRARA